MYNITNFCGKVNFPQMQVILHLTGKPGCPHASTAPVMVREGASQGAAGLSPGHGGGSAEDWMNPAEDMTAAGFMHRTRQGAPAPTSNLGPILAGAPCLGYPGKEGYIKNRLTVRK